MRVMYGHSDWMGGWMGGLLYNRSRNTGRKFNSEDDDYYFGYVDSNQAVGHGTLYGIATG